MKKRIEFLLLFAPLIILILLPIIPFFIPSKTPTFMGPLNYLRLFLNDSLFWRAFFNTYCFAFIFSVAMVLILALLRRFMAFFKKRRWFYGMGLALGSVASFLTIGIHNNMNQANGITPTWVPTIYEIIMGLQVGFLIMLLYWIAETLWDKRIKK